MRVAISASVHPANASRVTAVPRRSWNVTPTTPAATQALRQEDRNPSAVQGLPSELTRISGSTSPQHPGDLEWSAHSRGRLGALAGLASAMLAPGTMVALSGGGGKGEMRNSRLEVVSYWPVEVSENEPTSPWTYRTMRVRWPIVRRLLRTLGRWCSCACGAQRRCPSLELDPIGQAARDAPIFLSHQRGR